MPVFKYIALMALLSLSLYAAKVSYEKWEKGQTFSEYLEARQIPLDIMASISEEDQKFLTDIQSDYSYYELKDDNGALIQALIPISKEMQIHLFQQKGEETYGFDIIPIVYKSNTYYANVTIHENPYTDTLETTRQPTLAERVSRALRDTVETRKLSKGDQIAFVYTQKTRLGRCYLMPKVRVLKVRTGTGEDTVYVDHRGYGYTGLAEKDSDDVIVRKKIHYTRKVKTDSQGEWFGMPLRHVRVTSHFSYRRWHPILRRYRPHHGTDFGARRGTPLLAVNNGKVVYAGWMGGYGKVVKIKHSKGYVSLYAHQSRIRVKKGQRVKRGQIIGYVGSTGRSTGPHLHLGLSRYGRWVNPMKVLRQKAPKVFMDKQFSKYENVIIKEGGLFREKLEAYLNNDMPSYVWDKQTFENIKRSEAESVQ